MRFAIFSTLPLRKKIIAGITLMLTLALLPKPALALTTEVGEVTSFGDFVSQIWSWGAQIIFSISVISMIAGGAILMFAGGDSNAASSAKSVISGSITASLLVTFSAVIQNVLQDQTAEIQSVARLSDTALVVRNVSSSLLGIVGLLGVIALVFSGFRLIFSGGDFEKIAGAKKGVKFAFAGITVAFGAFFILRLLIAPLAEG